MKTKWISFVVLLALSMASCSPPPKAASVPRAVPTPHPAKGATEAAVRLYPDLAVKDSTFNRTFVEIYEQRKQSKPEALASVDWPLDVARKTAAMLGVSEYSPPTETPSPATPAPVVKTAPPREPNSLERGPYNEKRGVAKPPVLLDKNGYRIPVR